jgi:hypothetical protein
MKWIFLKSVTKSGVKSTILCISLCVLWACGARHDTEISALTVANYSYLTFSAATFVKRFGGPKSLFINCPSLYTFIHIYS